VKLPLWKEKNVGVAEDISVRHIFQFDTNPFCSADS